MHDEFLFQKGPVQKMHKKWRAIFQGAETAPRGLLPPLPGSSLPLRARRAPSGPARVVERDSGRLSGRLQIRSPLCSMAFASPERLRQRHNRQHRLIQHHEQKLHSVSRGRAITAAMLQIAAVTGRKCALTVAASTKTAHPRGLCLNDMAQGYATPPVGTISFKKSAE